MRPTSVRICSLMCLIGCASQSDATNTVGNTNTVVAGANAASPAAHALPQQSATESAATPAQPAAGAATGSAAAQPGAASAAPAANGVTPMQAQPGTQATPAASATNANVMNTMNVMNANAADAMSAAPAAPGVAPPEGFHAGAMGECDIHTKWPGDNYCILPPPPDKGFQLHIGPTNYDNPEPEYLLESGQENVRRYTAQSANDKDIQFYVRQYRMRPGAHHTIVMDSSTGRRLSGSDVNQDHPVGGIVAPENAGVGIPLAAHSPLTIDHHAINVTDGTLLQEVWVNFWYVDPDKVTETTTLLYDPGAVDTAIAPHEDVIMGPYDCDIQSPGRLINMFGHVHANDVRFSAWRIRGEQRDLIYESYNWEEPLWLEFTSLAKNPAPNPMSKLDGGWTGILDLQPGDKISWECHEVNQQNTTLRFTNETYNGWMCIIIGELVGTSCKGHLGFSIGSVF